MKKIAIVRRNGLGDLLCAFPLVHYFQRYVPDAEITLFVDMRNAPLLSYLPPVHEVVVFPNKGNKYLNLWRVARKHRKKFDLAFSAKTSPMKLMNFFLYWLKAKKSVAYVDDSWHSRLVNYPMPFVSKGSKNHHQALKSLQMVAPEYEEIPEELYPTITAPYQKRILPAPTVLVNVTTTRPASRFDEARYAKLLNQLHLDNPISVLIIGQAQDRGRAHAIAAQLKTPYLVHFPRNFDEFMLFLNSADLYFVEDGGVAHIGAALGKGGVVLFGQTHPTEWCPLSKKIETLYHPTHVNDLSDEVIFQALKRKKECERDN